MAGMRMFVSACLRVKHASRTTVNPFG
jgi:hypothetical protein